MRVRAISSDDGHEIGTEWDEDCADAARMWIERGIVEEVKSEAAPAMKDRQDKAIHSNRRHVKQKQATVPAE